MSLQKTAPGIWAAFYLLTSGGLGAAVVLVPVSQDRSITVGVQIDAALAPETGSEQTGDFGAFSPSRSAFVSVPNTGEGSASAWMNSTALPAGPPESYGSPPSCFPCTIFELSGGIQATLSTDGVPGTYAAVDARSLFDIEFSVSQPMEVLVSGHRTGASGLEFETATGQTLAFEQNGFLSWQGTLQPNTTYRLRGGASWLEIWDENSGSTTFDQSGEYQVTVSRWFAVPEPGATALAASLCCLSLGAWRRRTHRARGRIPPG